jgi:hypothetical protein
MEPVAGEQQSQARELAVAYRTLVLCFAGQLLLAAIKVGGTLTLRGEALQALDSFLSVGMAGSAVALCYFGYRTAKAAGSEQPWVWAIGMLVPCVGVVTLLLLSSKATQKCRAAGIPVGFLGPKL